MVHRIRHRDYKSGGGLLYHGKGSIVPGLMRIAKNRVNWLKIQIANSIGADKNKWIKEYELKDPELKKKANGLSKKSTAYYRLKLQEILNDMEEKENNKNIINPRYFSKSSPRIKRKTNAELRIENAKKFSVSSRWMC